MNPLRIVIEPNEWGYINHWQWSLEHFEDDYWRKLRGETWTCKPIAGFARTKEAARSRAESALKKYCDKEQAAEDRDRAHEEQTEYIDIKCT